MAKDSVIIKIDGKVSVADFRTVLNAFADLLVTLTAETNADAAVDWLVTDLSGGSACIQSQGVFGNAESQRTVELVIGKYEAIAKAAAIGKIDRFSDPVRDYVRTISSVVNGKIPRVWLGTPDEPKIGAIEHRIELPAEIPANQIEPRPNTRTSIKGQIVLLDQKHATYFTLKEAYGYNYVRCYPSQAHRSKLGQYWERKTWIIVEGTYRRNGDVKTMSQITDIVELPDAPKGGWRAAVGAAPRGPQANSMSAVEAVRKVRDGET